MMSYKKKLIEVALPLEAINQAAAREKSIRHGHPSTLHLWWARRPLAAARAVIFAQLVDDPSTNPDLFPTEAAQEAERRRLFRLIEELVKWENTTNETVLQAARQEIWQSWRRTCAANADHPRAQALFDPHQLPAFHDPFAGGGSLPLEAQRLGLEAYASDLNPVAVLINKAMIEIPPKFASQPPVNPESRRKLSASGSWKGAQGLAEDVRYYGRWMRDEAEKRIGHLYPKIEITAEMANDRPDLKPYVGQKLTVIAWLWARTVKSPNPAFAQVDVPLASTFMLSTKAGKEAYVEPVIENGGYRFTVKVGKPKDVEAAKNGTKLARGANFKCIMSDTPIAGDYIKAQGKAGRMGARLMAMVAEGNRGRVYLPPMPAHEAAAREAEPTWRPEGEIAARMTGGNCTPYGLTSWGDLFTPRQLVAMTTFSDLAQEALEHVKRDAVEAFGDPHPPTPSPSRGEGEYVRRIDFGINGDGMTPDSHDGMVQPARRIAISSNLERQMRDCARRFRKTPTPSENLLWQALRNRQLLGLKFRRQQPIGPFVVDFFCAEQRAIVEVDGPIHESQRERDAERQSLLEQCGYKVIRVTAQNVEKYLPEVLVQLTNHFNKPTEIPSPLEGEGVGGEGAQAYAEAVAVYLAFAQSKACNRNTSLCIWEHRMDRLVATFGRQALPMVWDFAETNPFAGAGGDINGAVESVCEVIERQFNNSKLGTANQADAVKQNYSLGKLISTDPPYYDNIGYADLSDFFYVWLRRSLRRIFPDLFATLSVPKAEELVATPYRHGSKEKAETFFLTGMTQAMRRLAEQSHPAFPVTIYYAFKQSENESNTGTASTGWETFLGAVIRAGFGVTGTWPIRTEQPKGLRAFEQNALASSIILVCRQRPVNAPTATRREFLTALKTELPAALAYLQHGNIAPVDLAQAAIGPGMAVYTRYAQVLDAQGAAMTVREALALINQILDEALAEQEGDFDPDSRWALAWFEQYGFLDGEFGVAETLSKAKNTSVAGLVAAGILDSKRGKVRLLKPDELPVNWDPMLDLRLTAWEMVHHLIRALESGGENAAASLVARLGGKADVARELAYRLYAVCERKKRAAEALSYNGLVQSWTEIARLAQAEPRATTPVSGDLFDQLAPVP